jgi:hypothetical protein
MTRSGLTLLAAGLLAGCAGTPDCSDGIAAARAAADAERPPGAWMASVDAACREAAEAAWSDALAADCAPVWGFHAARTESVRPGDCSGPAFGQAWNLGAMLAAMRREQIEIERRLDTDDAAQPERARLRQRLIVIERDRPQLEAIARMEGWLPPARIPDSDDD